MRAHQEGALGKRAHDARRFAEPALDLVDPEVFDRVGGHLDEIGARGDPAAAGARVRRLAPQPRRQRLEPARLFQVHETERCRDQAAAIARQVDRLEGVAERRQTGPALGGARQARALPEVVGAVGSEAFLERESLLLPGRVPAGEARPQPENENGRQDDGGVGYGRQGSRTPRLAHRTLQKTIPPASRTGSKGTQLGPYRTVTRHCTCFASRYGQPSVLSTAFWTA